MNVSLKTIRNLKLSQETAFDEVYNAYSALIYYIIFQIVQNREETKDLMQDAFIKMYQHIQELRDDKNFHYWFISIAKNIANNYHRKKKLSIELDETVVQKAPDNYTDYSEFIHSYLAFLSDEERQIAIYKFVHHLTFKQIAKILDLKTTRVTQLYYASLQKIKKNIYR